MTDATRMRRSLGRPITALATVLTAAIAAGGGALAAVNLDGASAAPSTVQRAAPLEAPVNDTCSGRTAIPDGPYPVLSPITPGVDAATSEGDPQPSCVTAPTDNGVWYAWTPSLGGVYEISTCPGETATDPGDGVLAVFTSAAGCDGPFTPIDCDDDACGVLMPSRIGPRVFESGVTYYIVASNYPAADGGGPPVTQYQLRIDPIAVPPSNDRCEGAVTVPPLGPFPWDAPLLIDIAGATSEGDPPAPACQPDVARSVWYSFTPDAAGRYALETCAPPTATTVDDTVIAVYSAPSGCSGSLVPVAGGCSDDACGFRSRVDVPLEAGIHYEIVVSQYAPDGPPDQGGALQLRVDRIHAPSNDTCASPATLELDVPASGTAAEAFDDYGPSGDACFTGIGQVPSSAPGRDVVFVFNAPDDDRYSFRAQDLSASGDLVLYVADACPPAVAGVHTALTGCLGAANRNANGAGPASTEEVSCLPLTRRQRVFAIVDRALPAAGGPFRLEATRCRRETEPNGTTTTSSSPACGLTGAIAPAGDVDFFSLGAPAAGGRVFALADGAAATSTDFDMRVTTATDTLEYDDLNADTPFGGLSPAIAGTRTTGGAAFLRVSHFMASVQSEPYSLYSVVQCAAASATPEHEPNDTIAQANTAVNGYFAGSLAGPSPSQDTDVYAFNAQAGEAVFIALDNDPEYDAVCTNTRLEIVDGSGVPLSTVNDSGSTSNARTPAGGLTSTAPSSCAEALVFRAPSSGTFYARVAVGTASTGPGGQGSYLLSIAPDCVAACDDGNLCTVNDACVDAVCTGAPVDCNDGDPCTDDSCDPGTGCVHVNNTAPCSDGNPCTTGDACDGGVCRGIPVKALACNDHNVCTVDSCDPETGGCVHTPVLCNDHDRNTIDRCDPRRGCVFTPRQGPPPSGSGQLDHYAPSAPTDVHSELH